MKLCVFISFVCLVTSAARGYKVCGGNTTTTEVQESVDEIVKRLMSVRSPSWGWDMWSTIVVLQVAAPRKFFDRQKSVIAFKRLINTGWDEMEYFDKCEAALVARALCLDPNKISGRRRSLLNEINDGLAQYMNSSPPSTTDLINFSFGLFSLCINDYTIDKGLVNKLLDLQNPEGSFGTGPKTYIITLWMIRPMFCLSQMKHTFFNVTRVTESVEKIRAYVISFLDYVFAHPHLGFSAHDALVVLWKSKPDNANVSKWYCIELARSVGIAPLDYEDEEDLNRRLLTITGTDLLDLQDENYKCLPLFALDKRPKGYKPTCNYEIPETCGLPPM